MGQLREWGGVADRTVELVTSDEIYPFANWFHSLVRVALAAYNNPNLLLITS